jgi:ferredoxin
MDELRNRVASLFREGTIDLFVGYEAGTQRPRPCLAASEAAAAGLIFDRQCTGNLAVYLTRDDVAGGKKVGIAASYYALKSICRLGDENRLTPLPAAIFGAEGDGRLRRFTSLEEIKQYLSETPPPSRPADDESVRRIDALSPGERWTYWRDELSRCFKCYACRAACPMCYCTKCIVEVNRPQWIQPWAATVGNVEWQISRVMHLAGRCSDCGACGAACPLGIPVHILTHKMAQSIETLFGESSAKGNVLSTFMPDDKETFIL